MPDTKRDQLPMMVLFKKKKKKKKKTTDNKVSIHKKIGDDSKFRAATMCRPARMHVVGILAA
jgi:hypothetical protein